MGLACALADCPSCARSTHFSALFDAVTLKQIHMLVLIIILAPAAAIVSFGVRMPDVQVPAGRAGARPHGHDRRCWYPDPRCEYGIMVGREGDAPCSAATQSSLVPRPLPITEMACMCVFPQLLTKFGALNVPEWYLAGEVAQKDSFASFGKQ